MPGKKRRYHMKTHVGVEAVMHASPSFDVPHFFSFFPKQFKIIDFFSLQIINCASPLFSYLYFLLFPCLIVVIILVIIYYEYPRHEL